MPGFGGPDVDFHTSAEPAKTPVRFYRERTMDFRVVERYYRQEHFDFYTKYGWPFYAATVRFDITALKAWADEQGHPTYLSLCYYFTRAAQAIEDFRYRIRDGRIVLYERLHPGLTVPAPDGLFSFAYLHYAAEPEAFFPAAEAVLVEAQQRVALRESEHKNYLYFTALPEVPFTGFSHAQSGHSSDVAPRVAFGSFDRQGDALFVPVGIQVSHVFIDGRSLGELVERVQALYSKPQDS